MRLLDLSICRSPKQGLAKSRLRKSSPKKGCAPTSRFLQCLKIFVETNMSTDVDMCEISLEKRIFGVSYVENISKEQMIEFLNIKK